jgi:hypothetical protein
LARICIIKSEQAKNKKATFYILTPNLFFAKSVPVAQKILPGARKIEEYMDIYLINS